MKFRELRDAEIDWGKLDSFPDRTVFQMRPWLELLKRTQDAQPVVAVLEDGGNVRGYFTGAIIRRFGVKILGSPLPGWSTSYMGFNLCEDVDRGAALEALEEFAFKTLGCLHLEIMDRHMTEEGANARGFAGSPLPGHELDLTPPEEQIFKGFHHSCRSNIRKADRSGVTIEECRDEQFIDDYYSQLEEVFARQGLAPTFPKGRVRDLYECLIDSNSLLMLRARDPGGECIATTIFLGAPKTAYWWGAASRQAKQLLRANEALVWYGMRYWKAHGAVRLDFGGGGSCRYKSKYGGDLISVPWVRKSRFRALEIPRSAMKAIARARQYAQARMKSGKNEECEVE